MGSSVSEDERRHWKQQQRSLWFIILPLSIILRFLCSYLLLSSGVGWVSWLTRRPELVHRMASHASIVESIYLARHGVDPYAGLTSSKAMPLVLFIFEHILPARDATSPPPSSSLSSNGFSSTHWMLLSVWSVLDCCTATMISALCRYAATTFLAPTLASPLVCSMRSRPMVRILPVLLPAIYLLNPYTLASSILFNLNHLTHFFLVLSLYSAVRGKISSVVWLACATYLDVYPAPALLIPALLLIMHQARYGAQPHSYPQYATDRFIRHDECRFIDECDEDEKQQPQQQPQQKQKKQSEQEQYPYPFDLVAAARQQRLDNGFTPKRILYVAYQPIELEPGDYSGSDDEATDSYTRNTDAPNTPKRQISSASSSSSSSSSFRHATCTPSSSTTTPVSFSIPPDAPARWNWGLFLVGGGLFTLTFGLMLYASALVVGGHNSSSSSSSSSSSRPSLSWSFLSSTYGSIFRLDDISPNFSLYWYFFLEMFTRFTSFFRGIFHAQILVYVPVLTWRLGGAGDGAGESLFLAAVIMQLSNILRPYPLLSDMILSWILMLVHLPSLYGTLRRIYPLIFLHLLSLVTQGLMLFLWVGAGSGNANFFFFQNLLFLFTAMFGSMELVGAARRRQAMVLEGRIRESRRRYKMYRNAQKRDPSETTKGAR